MYIHVSTCASMYPSIYLYLDGRETDVVKRTTSFWSHGAFGGVFELIVIEDPRGQEQWSESIRQVEHRRTRECFLPILRTKLRPRPNTKNFINLPLTPCATELNRVVLKKR